MRARAGLPFLLEEGMEVTFVPPVLRMPRSSVVTRVDEQGNGRFVVFFRDITSIDQSEKLTGHYCLVNKDDLPEGWDDNGELDLTGFTVIDAELGEVGQVVDMQENPAHPLLVVEHAGDEVLIPLVEEFIIAIEAEDLALIMDLPAGLLDL